MRIFDGSIAVIGGGIMGEAIVKGWLRSGSVDASRIRVVEPVAARRQQLASLSPAHIAENAADALPADLVVLAVKPQVIDSVLAQIAPQLKDALVVSIAAGISTARIESTLPSGQSVIRVMPNTPAMVGAGMAVVSGGSEATAEQLETVRSLFEVLGSALVIDERYQNAATAISGSGPAYFALVIDALARAGVAAGLPRNVAQELAIQTMRGTGEMLHATGQHPEALVDGVASPGGTTIAALTALESAGVRAAFADAVRAAVQRAEELG